MIRQHAPCVNTRRDRRDCGKQPVTEIRHPVGRVTDIWLVIETSCREMICAPTANAMRRAVPRKTMLLAPCDKRGALFRCQFAPEIHGDRKSTRSPDGKNVVNRSRLKAGLRTATVRSAGFSLSRLKAGLRTATVRSAGFSLSSPGPDLATRLEPPKGGTTNLDGL